MKKNCLMTHIVGGYPTITASEKIAQTMLDAGVDFLEIQIPFSDPMADGPTIAKANTVALKNNVTPDDCINLLKKLKKRTKVPLLLMTYYNIAFRYGLAKFCKNAKKAGCYGLIIPDLPIDEEKSEKYIKICKKEGLHPIQVISPLTPEKRLKKIGTVASGFMYCVARLGTTGENRSANSHLKIDLQKVRKYIKKPLALGFGISTAKDVRAAHQNATIAVIGSKILNLYNAAPPGKKLQKIREFLNALVESNSIH